ncbi:MAG: FlgD immunoglobulin-like domain containing protein [Candidatus Eiseniibacteriota bacterium]
MNVPRTFRGLAVPALIAGALVSLPATAARADWTQTSGPRGGAIRSFASVPNESGGTSLYVGQIRVWRTDDSGANWTHFTNGLTDPNAFALVALPDGSGGNDLFLGTANGVFRSADEGASWNASSSGIPANLSIYAMTSGPNGSGGTNLYAGTYLGDAYRSTDNGVTWTAINNGLPLGQAHVFALITSPTGTVLAGTGNGIYRSTNFGANWTRVFTLHGLSFAKNGTTLYAGTGNGVYQSTNDGATWTPINTGLNFTWIYSMAAIPNGGGVTLFAGAGGVLRSTNNGASWTAASNGLTSLLVWALTTVPNPSGGTDLYAGTGDGIFRSTDNGDSWTNVSFIYSHPRALEVTPSGAILAGTEVDMYRSTNSGVTWIDTNGSTVGSALDFATNLQGASGVSIFAGGSPTGVIKSTDDGATWFGSSNGLDDVDVNSVAAVPNGSGGTNILAGTYSELFISTNDGGHWMPANLKTLNLDYAVTPDGAGGHNIFAAGFGGVWRSTNGGTEWTWAGGNLEGQIVQALASTTGGTNVFAAGYAFGVSRSTNNGASWDPVNNGLTDIRIVELLSPDGMNLFAAGAAGVFLSSDNGNSWTFVGTGLTTGVASLAVSADGATLIAGTNGFGVWTRPLSEMIGGPVAVGDDPNVGTGVILQANHPNPFRGETTIQYSLPRAATVRLVIYDVTGRAVRTLVSGVEEAGQRRATWDGRDEGGSLAASGIYICRLEADGVSFTRKLSLLR